MLVFRWASLADCNCRLAYAELYLTTAMVHRRFETELYETVRDDIDMARDLFMACQKVGSEGLQVKVKE